MGWRAVSVWNVDRLICGDDARLNPASVCKMSETIRAFLKSIKVQGGWLFRFEVQASHSTVMMLHSYGVK